MYINFFENLGLVLLCKQFHHKNDIQNFCKWLMLYTIPVLYFHTLHNFPISLHKINLWGGEESAYQNIISSLLTELSWTSISSKLIGLGSGCFSMCSARM